MDALIGSTGYVGGTLLAQRHFAARYHSTDIAAIRGQRFGRLVCAGATAVKWWANANPGEDRRRIQSLMADLRHVEAERFVLISTIDVYGHPVATTEADPPAPTQPYGRHRLELERFAAHHFPRVHIVRLPALFGPGLKKNALYDLLHDNRLELVHPQSRLQWYPLARLADDLARTEAAGLPLVNLATPPLAMATIRDRFFPGAAIGAQAAPPAHYDARTRHAALFGGPPGYALGLDAVLAALAAFIAAERAP